MANPKPRVKVPKTARAGDIVTIKTLIKHKMESGHRRDSETGALVPRHIINHFQATYDGELVFETDIEPAVASNPYILFTMKVSHSGELAFTWTDDDGSVYATAKVITVT